MKKLLALVLCLMMMISCAMAEETCLPGAGAADCPDVLLGQASVKVNEADGTWSARSYQTEAVLDWFFDRGDRTETPVVVTVELEGDARTGMVIPLLKVYHFVSQSDAPVTAVSLLLGEMRYDFNVASQFVSVDGKVCEVLTAPLDAETLMLTDLLSGGTAGAIRLYGEEVTTIEYSLTSTKSIRKIETAALNAAATVKPMLEAAGMYGYDLWDLNWIVWEKKTGVKPMIVVSAVSTDIAGTSTQDDFGMVLPDEKSKAAITAQRLLIDAGFLAGVPEKTFSKLAVIAVKRAQEHYGLVQTGCMDTVLAARLSGSVPETAAEEKPELVMLGDVAGIELNRWWIAPEVRASRAVSTERTVSNSDNALIIADGTMMNASGEQIRFAVDMTAELVCNGQYVFDVIIVCEGNGGTTLETTMIPKAQSRVMVYAEVPSYLARMEDAQWTLTVKADDETVVYTLTH